MLKLKCGLIGEMNAQIYGRNNAWPIYTRAKIRVYAGLGNYVVYASKKSAFRQNGCSRMI